MHILHDQAFIQTNIISQGFPSIPIHSSHPQVYCKFTYFLQLNAFLSCSPLHHNTILPCYYLVSSRVRSCIKPLNWSLLPAGVVNKFCTTLPDLWNTQPKCVSHLFSTSVRLCNTQVMCSSDLMANRKHCLKEQVSQLNAHSKVLTWSMFLLNQLTWTKNISYYSSNFFVELMNLTCPS